MGPIIILRLWINQTLVRIQESILSLKTKASDNFTQKTLTFKVLAKSIFSFLSCETLINTLLTNKSMRRISPPLWFVSILNRVSYSLSFWCKVKWLKYFLQTKSRSPLSSSSTSLSIQTIGFSLDWLDNRNSQGRMIQLWINMRCTSSTSSKRSLGRKRLSSAKVQT